MSTRETPESGLYSGQVEFYRETTTGAFDSDPSYTKFSDEVLDVSYSPGFDISRRDAVGTPNPVGHNLGTNEGEIEITYRLQRQLVDGSGTPDDPAGDAWDRDSDNRIKNTHSIRIRDDRANDDPDDPANVSGARIYVIGKGGHPNNDMEAPIENGGPIESTISYVCEKVRVYEAFQPPGDEALDVVSTDSGDTSQTLTIEDDSGTSEDVSLNGTTAVTTTKADWASIRGFELDAEATGDVTISLSTSGDTLVTIRGAGYYGPGGTSIEGDLGVPVIGSGSLGSAVSNDFEFLNGATVQRGGSAFNYDVTAATWSVDNNYGTEPRHDSLSPRIDEGNRNASVEFDLIGWGVSPQFLDEALGLNEENVVVGLPSTDITWNNAIAVGPSDVERGPDDSAIAYGVGFEDSADNGVGLSQVT